VINWIVRWGLFSGLGTIASVGFVRWGYNRWRERPRDELTRLGTGLSYNQVRPRVELIT